METCDDGDDNDGDGWSDCQDDDCWGVAPCLDSHRVTLYGGTGVLHIEASKGDDWEAKAGLILYSMAGEVQVKTNYGSFATCAFSFEYGHLTGYGVGTGVNTAMVFPEITRSDFLIESGCDFKDDTAMPSFITLPKPGQFPMNAVIPFETTDGSSYKVSSTWYNGTVISGGYRYLLNTSTSARHTAFSIPGGTSIVIGE